MNIFVTKLSYDTQEDSLRQAFEEHGEVSSARIVIDRDTNRSKGFGFVEMPNKDEAIKAIKALDETDLDGRTIVVKEAIERENNGRSGGGNRGGFNRNNNNRRF